MPTLFPLVLDSFLNPTSSTTLDASGSSPSLRHHIQHSNINDAMEAVQTRIGTTGSTITNTIDFELHDVVHGHDHDGINSRPVALGTSGSVTRFDDGLFSFTVFTRTGDAISQINKALLDLSQSITSSDLTTQINDITLSSQTGLINISGSIVSASISGGTDVTYSFEALQEDSLALVILSDTGGPYEGFLSGSFREVTYTDKVFPSTKIWYKDSTKTEKIIEKFITYNSNKTPNTIVWNVYEKDGATIKTTATDTITYDGNSIIEINRTRTIT